MKKTKNIEGILRQAGIFDAMIESTMKVLSVDKDVASKIVQRRIDDVYERVGKNIQRGNYQINNVDSKLTDMPIEEILNNENIIKDK